MIVDAHAHWGPWFFSMSTGDVALNSALLDRFGIDVQLASAVEAIVYDPECGNRALAAQLDAERRLRGLVVLDPRDPAGNAADLVRYAGDPRWVGAKIHTHYSRSPMTSGRLREAVALATEHSLPVLVHTWGDEVVELAQVAADVPGSRVIAGHMGATAWPRVPEAAALSDRIWFEPCWSAPEAGRIRFVVDAVGADRFVFGSDATLIDPSVTLGAIAAAELSASQLDLVLGDTAAALFNLEPPDPRPSPHSS